jgi:hypothetical protein
MPSPAEMLIEATIAMHAAGTPLMQLVLPHDENPEQWEHYPQDDAISPDTLCRYFYHCHPPEERRTGEHGHFHLFLPLHLFPFDRCKAAPAVDDDNRARVVHLAAMSVDMQGLPLQLFTTNRWVTDEWMFAASEIGEVIDRFDLTSANGNALVNQWLTSFVALARGSILDLLEQRDAALCARNWPGEDRAFEIISSASVNVQDLIDAAL